MTTIVPTTRSIPEIEKYEHDATNNAKKVISIGSELYTVRLDPTTTTNITYIGKAVIGSSEAASVWQIKTFDKTASTKKILWEDGDSNFDNVWNDRASGSYS